VTAKTALQRSSSKHRLPDLDPGTVQALIEARRSIFPKDYTGEEVENDAVESILQAAVWAPTHGKTEPWRFIVFAHDKKDLLLNATLEWYQHRPGEFWHGAWDGEFPDAAAFSEYFGTAKRDKWYQASHLVAVCLSRQTPEEGKKQIPEWEEQAAVACAVHNMHLMATATRVAAYWSSWFAHYTASAECVEFLGLNHTKGDRCMGVFVIGQCEKMDRYRATRKGLEEVSDWR